MPFQKIIDQLRAMKGVEGVVFLDAEGETILSSGEHPETLKVLGAYQSIVLAQIRSLGWPDNQTIITICEQRSILTHHLKDGYFLCVVFSRELSPGLAKFRFQEPFELIKKEL
ncbi:MAG: hypothetical protein C5B54_00205 [Acidobacteria bacterium]|nr:MAG: hypothetical protein C5B54_00205 [Acidobacteriota bacterium]